MAVVVIPRQERWGCARPVVASTNRPTAGYGACMICARRHPRRVRGGRRWGRRRRRSRHALQIHHPCHDTVAEHNILGILSVHTRPVKADPAAFCAIPCNAIMNLLVKRRWTRCVPKTGRRATTTTTYVLLLERLLMPCECTPPQRRFGCVALACADSPHVVPRHPTASSRRRSAVGTVIQMQRRRWRRRPRKLLLLVWGLRWEHHRAGRRVH